MDVPVKNRELSKFLLCFKPITPDNGFVRPDLSDDECCRRKKRKPPRCGFSRIVRAVFFEKSLVKKIKARRCRKDSFGSDSDTSSKSENPLKSVKKIVSYDIPSSKQISRTNSNYSLSPFSSNPSSRSTSISSNSYASSLSSNSKIKRSPSYDLKNLNSNKQVSEKSFLGICIFLVSLFSLVIWGKVFAILTCTSSCLLFGPPAESRFAIKGRLHGGAEKKEHHGGAAGEEMREKEISILHACI